MNFAKKHVKIRAMTIKSCTSQKTKCDNTKNDATKENVETRYYIQKDDGNWKNRYKN